MKQILIATLALAACKSSDSATTKSEPKPAAAADPWAAKTPKVDPKDPDLAKMVELANGGPGDHEYPQADAVLALDRDDITMQVDGTLVEHHKSIVKLLDAQRGKNKFADVHIPFDTKRQKLDV